MPATESTGEQLGSWHFEQSEHNLSGLNRIQGGILNRWGQFFKLGTSTQSTTITRKTERRTGKNWQNDRKSVGPIRDPWTLNLLIKFTCKNRANTELLIISHIFIYSALQCQFQFAWASSPDKFSFFCTQLCWCWCGWSSFNTGCLASPTWPAFLAKVSVFPARRGYTLPITRYWVSSFFQFAFLIPVSSPAGI